MSKFRLLTKREIDVAKAKDRQREIDEGAKLARRVNSLRELAATEETGLDDLRRRQLTNLQADIEPKISELESLKTEIRGLENKRRALLEPLDQKERDLEAREETLDKRDEELSQKEVHLKLAISANIQRERQDDIERGRIEDERAKGIIFLSDADSKLRKADSIVQDARNQAAAIFVEAELKNNEVIEREKSADIRELALTEREKMNKTKEKDLRNRERVLRDRYETLIRNQKRLDNGKQV